MEIGKKYSCCDAQVQVIRISTGIFIKPNLAPRMPLIVTFHIRTHTNQTIWIDIIESRELENVIPFSSIDTHTHSNKYYNDLSFLSIGEMRIFVEIHNIIYIYTYTPACNIRMIDSEEQKQHLHTYICPYQTYNNSNNVVTI